jgi:hypothetical protein
MTTTREDIQRDYNAMVRDMEALSAEAQELRVELMAAKERIWELEDKA